MNYLKNILNDEKPQLTSLYVTVDSPYNGVFIFKPKSKSKMKIVLSCGIHGNETAPIEIINDLVTQIIDGTVTLVHELMIIFGNTQAMKTQERFIDFNLNRLFSQQWKNESHAQESNRAKELEIAVSDFFSEPNITGLHLDLHTAIAKSHHEKFAIVPACKDKKHSQQDLSFLSSLGLDALVMEKNTTTTFSSYTQNLLGGRGLSATVELGKVYPFGQNDRSKFTIAEVSIKQLLSQDELPQSKVTKKYYVTRTLIKDHQDYKLCLTKDDINFTLLDSTKVLEVTLNGDQFPGKNEYIIFPNQNVEVGQRSGLIISTEVQCND